jgi:hypothetical protein
MNAQQTPLAVPKKIQEKGMLEAVDITIKALCPTTFDSVCYIYAIVASNLMTVALKKNYRPVAGIALIDAGGGKFLEFLDDSTLESGQGGAYHCWVESADARENPKQKELVDFTFGNNPGYAEAHGIKWTAPKHQYLWGLARDINLGGDIEKLPKKFPPGKVWFQETKNGQEWISAHLHKHVNDYAKMTFLALRQYNHAIEEYRSKRTNFKDRLKALR